MPSGKKTLQFNTQERAISTDENRLQAFAAYSDGELFRYMLNTSAEDDMQAAAVISDNVSEPMPAEIINGLMMQPQAGNLNIAITPGCAYVLLPDGDPDASAYKYVRDSGSRGVLTMTAGGGGAPRLDVIECQPSLVVVETDNRDIYNPTTGLFVATTVPKATQYQMTYRVRLGTPGAGFPGAVTGWTPLAVALVAGTATTNDQIVFWDVRPLLNDRVHTPFALKTGPQAWMGQTLIQAAPSLVTTTGYFSALLNGRRLGGELRSGNDAGPTLTTDADSIDLTSAINQEAGFTAVAWAEWFLYLATPYGLPRWARYTTSPVGRVPRSPRGIPIVSRIGPNPNGSPTSPIPLPASWGSGSVDMSSAVCVSAGYFDSGAVQQTFMGNDGGVFVRNSKFDSYHNDYPSPPAVTGTIANPFDSMLAFFTFSGNIHFPANAKWIYVEAALVLTMSANGTVYLLGNVFPDASFGTPMVSWHFDTSYATTGANNGQIVSGTWVPVQSSYPSSLSPIVYYGLYCQCPGTTPTGGTLAKARVTGWRL
jgi:hypothetical protein